MDKKDTANTNIIGLTDPLKPSQSVTVGDVERCNDLGIEDIQGFMNFKRKNPGSSADDYDLYLKQEEDKAKNALKPFLEKLPRTTIEFSNGIIEETVILPEIHTVDRDDYVKNRMKAEGPLIYNKDKNRVEGYYLEDWYGVVLP